MSKYGHIIFSISVTAFILALAVVVLGAYVRLSDAGLGCPDWPGCYGQILVPDNVEAYISAQPQETRQHIRPLETHKALKEMVHRYLAGALGFLILLLALISWCSAEETWIRAISGILLLLVIAQVLLGMWTVTLLLKPVVVALHLIGGMSILALLFLLSLRLGQRLSGVLLHPGRKDLLPWAGTAIIILSMQIALGAWTSANYAALVCPDFPTCQGQWLPQMDFNEGFTLWHELGVDYEGGILSAEARTAIHFTHRIGALVTALMLLGLCLRIYHSAERQSQYLTVAIGSLLTIQIALGISNIIFQLPMAVALAHQVTAMLLILSLVFLVHYSLPIHPPKLEPYLLDQ